MEMPADKRSYIENEMLTLLQYWGGLVFGPGAFVILLLSLLDYFVTPENFSKFLIYRLITATVIVSLYFVNKQKKSKYLP